ncbi:MAG: hypothetical protein ACOC32_02005 [Nanoarchaeota archaeon]
MGQPKIAPLPGSFFFTSIIGLYISLIYVMKRWPDFGFAFSVIFGVMFIASIISLTYAPAKLLLRMEEYERSHKGAKVLTHKEYEERKKKKKN